MKKFPFIIFFIACFQVGIVYGNEQPIVRASASPDTVVVGSEVTLTITVLVPTWFSKSLVYPSMEMEGVVTLLPPDSTYAMSEMVEGNSWSGITREYKIYPLGTGKFSLQGKRITIAYADPKTRKPVSTIVSLPELHLSAVVPVGAEKLSPFLAGSSLELIQEIPQVAEIYRPGDAVERKITVRLEGMPSLFLPPLLSQYEEQGISVYPGTPSTDDEYGEDGQSVTGIRKEGATYVFERGGIYTFPAVTLRWWNIATGQIETAGIPAIVFQVEKSFAQQLADLPRGVILAIIIIVLVLVLCIIYFRKTIQEILSSSWKRFYRSELFAFLRILFRVLFHDSRTAYFSILSWQRRFAFDRDTKLGSVAKGPFFTLEASIYGPDSRKGSFNFVLKGKLVVELLTIRSRTIREKQRLKALGVDYLNPV